ncbi:CalY family protein [Metabacillus sp. GX 13764]|uniref:TasA family protein n=1 Tax=Metabacillus kandeliae TaxID=2900151 RepID=UPI001E2A447C|nr:TasA family protein [Metabacillus kandeliae]MCD7033675.1 CalY family protein [Metabacillus kandeliae]
MGFAKNASKGFIMAALGFSLIGGGTYAYFSDSVNTQNTFASGTLDLSVDPEAVVNADNLKPGDEIKREFTLANDGTLDISKVLLDTDYSVIDAKLNGAANQDDLAKHIKVTIMYNQANATSPVIETTLYELKSQKPDLTAIDDYVGNDTRPDGLKPGEKEKIIALFEFVDNGQDQNEFQGDSLKVNWKFNAEQMAGSLDSK